MAYTINPTSLPWTGSHLMVTAGVVTQVNLPTTYAVNLNVHNRDKASKTCRLSFDQTLTDGAAAPTEGWTIDNYLCYPLDGNGANGLTPITKLFIYSPADANVTVEFMLSTRHPA